jgi:hypothetical protein
MTSHDPRSFRGGDGSLAWTAPDGAALAPVFVARPGLTVTVDPANPHRVLDLAATNEEAIRDRAGFFDPPAITGELTADPESVQRITLSPAATRLATTLAVTEVHLGDLDESLLMLDRAVALANLGDTVSARRVFGLASAATELLADRIEEDGIGGPLLTGLLAALTALGPTVTGELRAWQPRMRGRTDLAGASLDRELATLLRGEREADLSLTALAMTGDDQPDEPVLQLTDLRPLPPRLLRFTGPDDPDLEIRSGDGDLITVTATLRDEVIADTEEVLGLFAVAADPATGRMLASAPIRVVGREVRAELYLPGRRPDQVNCALIGSDAEPDVLRLDNLGTALIEIDRHLRFAWTMHRRAGAIRAAVDATAAPGTVDAAAELAREALAIATEAATTAQDLLRQEARRRHTSPEATPLATYSAQIDAFAGTITGPPQISGPAGPTLTELAAEVLT